MPRRWRASDGHSREAVYVAGDVQSVVDRPRRSKRDVRVKARADAKCYRLSTPVAKLREHRTRFVRLAKLRATLPMTRAHSRQHFSRSVLLCRFESTRVWQKIY